MSRYLLIVESPTKAKTISKFLPSNYDVIASIGHVRDLPRSATDIPKKYKAEKWSRLGIDVDNNFKPLFVNIKGKSKVMSEIKQKLKNADTLILATDEDREGESIAWHLVETLNPKIPTHRMVFHEITKNAINHALEQYRSIDPNLVKAQETRRILDRLVGYKLSELLWKKITYRISAGRVQSPGLRLLVERERERYLFKKTDYHDIFATFEYHNQEFAAKMIRWNDERIAIGSDFDNQGKLIKSCLKLDDENTQSIIDAIKNKQYIINKVETKPQQMSPPAPFITSTLQQEANRRLRLTARETMRTAQTLYEQGYITYMRTDSYMLSGQALNAARNYIEKNFDKKYLPEKPNFYGRKSKGAQEAHEAIRPSGNSFSHPNSLNIVGREKALYTLIWQRTVASQMERAMKNNTAISISVNDDNNNTAIFTVNGSVLTFPGFLALYTYSKVDDKILPQGLDEGTTLPSPQISFSTHETKPPSRYNDASLVKQLEERGIGRPSTYASIINTLLDREYARRVDQALVPTLMGFSVIQFLEKNFPKYVDYEFTSHLEDTLDEISEGKSDSLSYLKDFYFGKDGLQEEIEKGSEIDVNESQVIQLPDLDEKYEIRIGRYGPFVIINHEKEEDKENFSLPADCDPSDLHQDYIDALAEIKRRGPEPLGTHPDTREQVYCLTGRFGPYVQQGKITEDNPKPKRASIPRTMKPHEITIDIALKLLSVPKELGVSPENNEPIIAAIGRFGPFIKCGETTRSLKKSDDVYTITKERALEILAEQPVKKRKRGPSVVKELGEYQKKKIGLYSGPYGHYLRMGTKNIGLPEDKKEPNIAEKLTLEQAIVIIKESKEEK